MAGQIVADNSDMLDNFLREGLSLQHLCHHAILFDYPPNETLRVQAIGRLQRVDQRLSKAIPSMVAELNKQIFRAKEEGNEIDLGQWAVGADGALVKRGEEGERMEEDAESTWLVGEDVVRRLPQLMGGEECPVP
ncbi:hypothetical protein MGYG_00401 [Nannizzia gypsea CBS 118893]|uniref:Uncharacterized protein n=1 Tax=Arthroderma gypseum (strain ATCC MYA-4604 / CBS 118893) TaxID=535722 RepID=E5QZJ6_ARTGP|nr:hypothetical protein MGYG_00401 [Nannizzia gypsea CBS 118893]EFQ97362.1 hypothetical protein MGYG_00401 [Nannizzia gypsea CBS 118893]